MEQLLRDSANDTDSNDGCFDESLLQPTEKTPEAFRKDSSKLEPAKPATKAK